MNEAISRTYRNDKSRYIRNTLSLDELILAKIEGKKCHCKQCVGLGGLDNKYVARQVYVDSQEIGVVYNRRSNREKIVAVKFL